MSRSPSAFLELQPSETAVFHAASRIYAAHVAAGRVDEGNEGEVMKRCIRVAIRLALLTDKTVQSDDEEW